MRSPKAGVGGYFDVYHVPVGIVAEARRATRGHDMYTLYRVVRVYDQVCPKLQKLAVSVSQ